MVAIPLLFFSPVVVADSNFKSLRNQLCDGPAAIERRLYRNPIFLNMIMRGVEIRAQLQFNVMLKLSGPRWPDGIRHG